MRPPIARRPISTQINMTPMIDVTFQLIIFFLLSSHLAQQETQAEVELPAAFSGQEAVDEARPRLTVNVQADGSVMLGSTQTTTAEMAGRLRIERDKLGDAMEVRLRADRSVAYAAIEPILLACAEAGIWNVTFAVHERVESRESRVESRKP
jgi:biopolymer transport protein ExbD